MRDPLRLRPRPDLEVRSFVKASSDCFRLGLLVDIDRRLLRRFVFSPPSSSFRLELLRSRGVLNGEAEVLSFLILSFGLAVRFEDFGFEEGLDDGLDFLVLLVDRRSVFVVVAFDEVFEGFSGSLCLRFVPVLRPRRLFLIVPSFSTLEELRSRGRCSPSEVFSRLFLDELRPRFALEYKLTRELLVGDAIAAADTILGFVDDDLGVSGTIIGAASMSTF